MAVVNLEATVKGNDIARGKGAAGNVISLTSVVTTNADDSATSTYDFGDIPSNARILGQSTYWVDDLASAGSPTLDIGLFGDSITDDDDAFTAGISLATAGSNRLISDFANIGKEAWEYVSGQSSDPKSILTVKGTLKDADINTAGDIVVEIYYTID